MDSDEEMWESGKRDLFLILEHLDHLKLKNWDVFEYGCGVGRILKPASEIFRTVVGSDVSEVAIKKAKELLSNNSNILLALANGSDLGEYKDDSFDLVYSFACLNHIPLYILPNILIEIHRLVKLNCYAVLQLYIGANPEVVREDTITIRGYPEVALKKIFIEMGFYIENSQSLNVPFDAKDYERNLTPHIFTLRKVASSNINLRSIAHMLNPNGEIEADPEWEGSIFEYRLSATLLKKQAQKGEIENAIKTLNFALEKYGDPEPGAIELLERLKRML